MKNRKTLNHITIIVLCTIAVLFAMWSIMHQIGEAKLLFEESIEYPTGEYPSSVAIGDFNGDNHLDLAVTNKDNDNVSILLGNGDGTFQAAVDYAVGGRPLHVVIGDLNGDDNPDVAVANISNNNVSVLINTGEGANKLLYTPVTPCRIVDTRKTENGIIGADHDRQFYVYGSDLSWQGGNPAGCPAPMGEPFAAHINMTAVSPSSKGNMQAYPTGGSPGANLIVNFADIGTNFANAGTVQTAAGAGPDITLTSRCSSAHAVVDVLGYYSPAP